LIVVVRHAFSSPIDNRIVFFVNYEGTENFQIYKIESRLIFVQVVKYYQQKILSWHYNVISI
jgi:hypothetical protein